MDPRHANVRFYVFLLNSSLHLNPTTTFIGVTFNRTLFFSTHVSSLKPNSFFASRCYAVSLLPHRTPPRSPSLFYTKLFFGWFSVLLCFTRTVFFSQRYQRYQVKMSSPSGQSHQLPHVLHYPLLLRHFYLFYESPRLHFANHFIRVLRLPTSFFISGLSRLIAKPKLCRSS